MFSRLLEVARDRAGAAMLEFAIVLPLLIIVLVGILQLGIMFYDWVQVEKVAVIGLGTFLQNRPIPNSSSTCPTNTCPNSEYLCPYSNTVSTVHNSTNLPSSQLTITMSVGGTTCTSDGSCGTALCTAYSTTGPYSEAQTASVTVSYPCLTLLPVSWVARVCPGGVLASTFTQRVD